MKLFSKLLLVAVLGSIILFTYYKFGDILNNAQLELSVYPPQATIKIEEQIYHLYKGKQIIRIPPGQYTLSVIHPNYYPQTQIVSLGKREKKSLHISLLPINWPQQIIVNNQNIQKFHLIDKGNKIIYLIKLPEKGKKIKYQLELFDRSTKKSIILVEDYYEPIFIDFAPRKILYKLKSYYLKFLSSVFPNSEMKLQEYLKKNTGQQFDIKKVNFSPLEENKIIFQTDEALYQFDFLEDNLEKIVPLKTSFYYLKDNKIYFFTPEGTLFNYNLQTKESKQISLFVFKVIDNPAPQVFLFNNSSNFLILDSNQKLYFVEENKLPQLLAQEVTNFWVSPEYNRILIQKGEGKVSLLNLNNLKEQDINIQVEKIISWLPDNSCFLYLLQNNLFVYSLAQNKSFILAKDIINNQIQVDNSLKQIFYLNKEGIQMTKL